MNKIKVLIVDDSVVYRSQIKAALSLSPQIEVVGAASNGKIALDKLVQTAADVMILDLEMPEMNGLETLVEMKNRRLTTPVIVFSSASRRGAEITFEALRLGAKDFIAKPGADSDNVSDALSSNPSEKIRTLLEPKIFALFPGANVRPEKDEIKVSITSAKKYPQILWDLMQPKVLVIGSSTGGPSALEKIFSQFKGPLRCPIFIAQHMPPIFTATLAERIGKLTGIQCAEGKDGEVVSNRIYLAPGDFHMTLKSEGGNKIVIALDKGPQINSVRPAVDPLFESAAKIYSDRCLGIVLTGMGYDGQVGAERIKTMGGAVAIQSEDSCVVFGMPRAVKEVGAYDKILHLNEFSNLLNEKVGTFTSEPIGAKRLGGI